MNANDNRPQSGPTEDVLIILPVANTVLFPGVVLPVALSGDPALAAAQEAVRTQRRVGLLLQTDPGVAAAGPDDLHRIGTAATIVRFITAADGTHHLIAQGEERFTVLDYVSRDPFLVARIERHRNPRPWTAKSKLAGSIYARRRSRPCSCCRRPRANWSTPFAASSRFRRLPTWWRASWT